MRRSGDSAGLSDAADDAEWGADPTGYRPAAWRFSTNAPPPSANRAAAQDFVGDAALSSGMDSLRTQGVGRRLPDFRLALKTIVAFWLFYFALVTVRGLIMDFPDQWAMLQRRAVVAPVGALITLGIYFAMRPTALSSLRRKSIVAALICFPASILFAAFSYYMFYVYATDDAPWIQMTPEEQAAYDPVQKALSSIADGTVAWYFFFAAWAALYVAMSYAAQLRAADRRAAVFAREAQEAQLRALRYQINPHFLFNTLNSLSSLILSQRTDVAERMILNLSTFFRTTLSADPTADISLGEEIQLQRLYLDIEQIRFPDRLKVEFDIPEGVKSARVPVLILQPVIENAIKYGVARSRRPVTIRISAQEDAGRLHLKVKDDGDATPPEIGDCDSTGVGLRNVCDRLIARYGVEAGCFHGADPAGGYSVHIIMPVIRHD